VFPAGLTASRAGPYAGAVTARHRYRRPRLDTLHGRSLDPRRAARLRELASAYLELGRPEAAAEILKGAVVLDVACAASRVWLAFSLYRQGELDRALAWIEGDPAGNSAERFYLWGIVLRDQGRLARALDMFGKAVAADSSFAEARLERGWLWLRLGRPAEALAEGERLIETRPARMGVLLRARAFLALGRAGEAAETLRALPASERSFDTLELLLRALRIQGAAEREIEAVLASERERLAHDARVDLLVAEELVLRSPGGGRELEQAEEILRRLLDRPSLAPAVRARACFLLADLRARDNRDLAGAERLLEQGLSLAPGHPHGLMARASLEIVRRRLGRAMRYLVAVLLSHPDEPRLPLLLARTWTAMADDDAVAGWIDWVFHAVPSAAPGLLTRTLRLVQEEGRAAAMEDLRRESHRMKNRLAVFAAGLEGPALAPARQRAEELYVEWNQFLRSLRTAPERPVPLEPADVLRRALLEAGGDERVACSVAPDLPLLAGDGAALSGALANVIRNALEASPDAAVKVRVRSRDGGRHVEFSVTDFGPGIALSDQPRVFDAGFSRKPEGSGLGLAVARATVLGHGGRLRLASAPGGPTTVTIELPARHRWSAPGEESHGRSSVAG